MFKLFKNVSYKLWQRSILVIFLLEIMLIGLVIADGSKVWANRMAVMSSFAIKVVDLVIVRDDPVLKNQLLKMLNSQTHFVFLPDHIIQDTAPPPPFPIIQELIKSFNSGIASDAFVISFQETPPMFWIQRKQPPYYTLGFEWYSIARVLPAVSVVLMLLTLALTAVLNGWITRRVSHSISEIAKEAQLIAHNPTIKELTIPENTIPEIIQLAEALNNMHADINRLMKERELFLAEISHDIRTPLSRLHMVADVLEEDSFIFAKSMLEDIKEMTVILNQTVELGHANAALDELVVKGDINKLLTDIQTKYSRVDVSLDLVLGIMPNILFKKVALIRLLYNLIDNAIKYGSHDIDVRLVSAMDGTVPTVSVINSVLQQEYASDNNTLIKNYAANSSGLGLKIVERIAKMQGIEVTTIKNLHSQTHTVQLRFSKN